MPLDTAPARSTQGVPFLDAVLKVEDTLDYVRLELVAQFLELLVSDVGQLDLILLRQRNSAAGDVVSLPERYLVSRKNA